MEIITANPDHAKGIAEVHVRSWQQAYCHLLPADYLDSLSVEEREQQWVDILTRGKSEVFLCVEDNDIVGFISYGPSEKEDSTELTAKIFALYVAPSRWHKGIGRALWQNCHNKLKADAYQHVVLWVIVGNERAKHFYGAMGFQAVNGSVKPFILHGVSLLEQQYVVLIEG